jgi:O-antigen/teichoic acid export membrane protein
MATNTLTQPKLQGYALTMFNLVTSIATMVLNFAIGFFLSPFIVKHLGAEANGFSQLASNFVMYASLVTLAFNSMSGRFISVSYHKGETDKANQYFTSVYAMNLLVALITLPGAVYVIYNLENLLSIETANLTDVKILFACVFFNFYLGLATSIFGIGIFVRNVLYIRNFINVVTTLSNAIILLVVFNVLPVRLFYVSLVSSILALILVPFYIHLQKQLLPEISLNSKHFSWSAVKEMFLSGIWNTVNQCGHIFNTGCDLLLANLFINPATMGVLAISKTVPSIIINLAHTVNNNFSPSVTIKWAEGNFDSFMRDLRVSMKISSIVVTIPIVTFCCYGIAFYTLWMPTQNAVTINIASILALSAFIPVAGTQTLYNVFTAANKLKVNSISFCIGAIINVVIVYICLKYKFLNGLYVIAGTSSVISIIRNISITLPYTAKILGLKWYTFYADVAISLICTAINLLLAFLVKTVIVPNSWVMLILSCAVTVGLSLVANSFILLSKRERQILFSKLKLIKS